MRNVFAILFFISTVCVFTYAQTQLPEFEKVKQIKLLESTREDVKKILATYEYDSEYDDEVIQDFSSENAEIEVKFSRGACSEDSEYWNVQKWTVIRVKITPEGDIKLKDFKFDFSTYKKETEEDNLPEFYRLHNENAGIVFEINDGEIEEISFYPPKSRVGFLCNNENSLKILSGKKQLTDLLYDPIVESPPAMVTNLTLSVSELTICGKSVKFKKCLNNNMKVNVTTLALDAENDVLTYEYKVSGGKIDGKGSQVIWDLQGVNPGTYTITAGVSDGCGICGATITKTVDVKECSDCSVKDN